MVGIRTRPGLLSNGGHSGLSFPSSGMTKCRSLFRLIMGALPLSSLELLIYSPPNILPSVFPISLTLTSEYMLNPIINGSNHKIYLLYIAIAS